MHPRPEHLLLIATLAMPAAATAGTCHWADSRGWAALRQTGRIVELRREVLCPAEASGTLEATISIVGSGAPRTLQTESVTVKPTGKWEQIARLQTKLFPYGTNAYCEEKPGKRPGKVSLRLDEGELKPSYTVRLRLETHGTGDLAGLRLNEELEASCLLCPSGGGSFNIYDSRAMSGAIKPGTRFKAEINRADWECLSTGATLEIRYFLAASHRDAEKKLRPDRVQTGVEKAFKVGHDKATLELAPPVAELCRSGATKVVLELGGRGQLRRLSGRLHLDLKCK